MCFKEVAENHVNEWLVEREEGIDEEEVPNAEEAVFSCEDGQDWTKGVRNEVTHYKVYDTNLSEGTVAIWKRESHKVTEGNQTKSKGTHNC